MFKLDYAIPKAGPATKEELCRHVPGAVIAFVLDKNGAVTPISVGEGGCRVLDEAAFPLPLKSLVAPPEAITIVHVTNCPNSFICGHAGGSPIWCCSSPG